MPFLQAGVGAVLRSEQDKLRESISAADFGALGDNSALKVDRWLTGGSHSRGAADLAELRAMTGIADLALTDTIDWAAITMALKAAGPRPVLLLGTGYHRTSRPIVIEQGGLMAHPSFKGAVAAVTNTFNLVHLKLPPASRIVLKDLYLTGGSNTVYGEPVNGGYIDDNSVIENLQVGGPGHGFFLDGLQAIGCRFNNIRIEGCGGNGFWFRGNHILNAAQIINPRAATCKGCGMLFENLSDQADTSALLISGATAEYNYGPGMKFDGYTATVLNAHFEGNDNDQNGDGPDFLLSSSGAPSASRVHSVVTAISPYFSAPRHPQGIRIAGSPNGTQTMVLVAPTIRGGVIDAARLNLTVIGTLDPSQILNRGAAFFGTNGLGVTGVKSVGSTPETLRVPALSATGGVLKILASRRASAGGAAVAEYLVRRNEDGTITPTFLHGTHFLTFAVDSRGNITATCPGGSATVSVYGH